MAVSLPVRVRVGFSLAVLTVLTTSGSFLLGKVERFRPHLYTTVIAIAAVGLVFLIVGRLKAGRADSDSEGSEKAEHVDETQTSEDAAAEHPLEFFQRMDYWGWIVMTSAASILCFTLLLSQPEKPVRVAHAAPKPKEKPVEVQVQKVEVEEAPPFVFPAMELSGFVCNGSRSTAVINKNTMLVGETVDGITLIEVDAEGVTVEVSGNQKRLTQETQTAGVQIALKK